MRTDENFLWSFWTLICCFIMGTGTLIVGIIYTFLQR
jgi:hypothetical protein